MVCEGQVYEEPVLIDPVLIGGLPGIGFVANIASLHLVRELKAKLFTEIRSSFFQDIAVTITKKALELTKHAKRKTVSKADIKIALQSL